MSLRSIRFRIDAFPQILLAAALTAAAGAAQAQPASATGSRAQTPAPAAPALTPKRSFDDTPLPAATPAATPTPESATPAGTGALPPRTRRRPPRPSPRLPPEPAPCRRVPPRRLPLLRRPPFPPPPPRRRPPPIRSSSCRRRKTPRPAWTSCAGRHGQRPDARRLGQVHRRRQAAADHGVLGRASPKAARAGGTTSPRRSTTSAWPTAR